MTTPNNPSQVTSQNEPKSTNSNNNSLIVALLVIVFVVVAILIGVVLFIVFVFVPRPNTPDLYQTCLNSPNTQGCVDCQNNGENGIICNRCEYLNEIIMKNEPFSGKDEEYYKEYCTTAVSDDSTDDQVQVTQPSQSSLTLFGTEWPVFDYTLPFGGNISGIAPISHAFGTDSTTSSGLGNTINFSFDSYDSTNVTNVQISIVQSEGIYTYYEEIPAVVNSGLSLYRIVSSETKSILYTDSYETTKCTEYVNLGLSEPTGVDVCGTGMLFDHAYYASCSYNNDMDKAVAMCDEFFKNLSIK